MTGAGLSRLTRPGRPATLAAIILLQALCAFFFIGDVISDTREDPAPDPFHLIVEAGAAFALCIGVLFLMLELRRLLCRMDRMTDGLRAARGQMAEVMEAFFVSWGLTASERDVAMMILKGIDNETIASLRGTAPGTVRAQCTRIYAKAGVDGRAQLLSVFMEELFAGELGTETEPPLPAGVAVRA